MCTVRTKCRPAENRPQQFIVPPSATHAPVRLPFVPDFGLSKMAPPGTKEDGTYEVQRGFTVAVNGVPSAKRQVVGRWEPLCTRCSSRLEIDVDEMQEAEETLTSTVSFNRWLCLLVSSTDGVPPAN